jgi:hypothetical protein
MLVDTQNILDKRSRLVYQFPATRRFIATIPGCSSYANLRTCSLRFWGHTILVPRKTSCPTAHSSLRTGKYSLCTRQSHLPLIIHSRTDCNSGSCSDPLSILRVVVATGVASLATNLTYSSPALTRQVSDSGLNSLDNGSAKGLLCS